MYLEKITHRTTSLFFVCARDAGSRYEGEHLHGKRHGYGTFYYPDGSKYVGSLLMPAKYE
jgi:hypothetical protein